MLSFRGAIRHVSRRAVFGQQRSLGSTSMEDDGAALMTSVYVHQVSKTVLQRLQRHHHKWLATSGLDRGLHLNANGTFTLKFPPSGQTRDTGRIW